MKECLNPFIALYSKKLPLNISHTVREVPPLPLHRPHPACEDLNLNKHTHIEIPHIAPHKTLNHYNLYKISLHKLRTNKENV